MVVFYFGGGLFVLIIGESGMGKSFLVFLYY